MLIKKIIYRFPTSYNFNISLHIIIPIVFIIVFFAAFLDNPKHSLADDNFGHTQYYTNLTGTATDNLTDVDFNGCVGNSNANLVVWETGPTSNPENPNAGHIALGPNFCYSTSNLNIPDVSLVSGFDGTYYAYIVSDSNFLWPAGTHTTRGYYVFHRNGGVWTTDIPSYYTEIKNTSNGYWNLYDASSTSANVIKTLPEDWIVYVASSTDSTGNYFTNNGFHWYKAIDPTDNVSGWMKGEDSSSTVDYLPFNSVNQTVFEATSTDYIATSSRPTLILKAVDNYYDGANSSYSLYNSDDGSNDISQLKSGNYEKKVIWGMAARESGPNFDNENVSYDYGHGIMQLTFDAWSHEPSDPHATFDNTGAGSHISVPPCASLNSSSYTNCYTNAGTADTNPKHYQPYAGNSNNPTYKLYTNTEQSIYSNIKDGLRILSDKFNNYSGISASTTVNGTTFSPTERKIISATENYNGACGYVNDVADRLDDIGSYFSGATTSDISTLVQKMHTAGTDLICAQLHSPADLSIQDSKGHKVGVVNGEGRNDFPMAVYDKDQKFAKIFFPRDENYTYKLIGTGSGTYGLDITIIKGSQVISFETRNVPIVPGQIDTYTVDKNAVLKHLPGVTLKVHKEGKKDTVSYLEARVKDGSTNSKAQ